MESLTRLGRIFFGTGMLAFGMMNVVTGVPVLGIEPIPDGAPAHAFWAYGTGVLLIAGGVGVWMDGRRAQVAAIGLGVLLFLWLIALHLPTLATHIHNGSVWTSTFECLALCSGAWILAAALAGRNTDRNATADRLGRLAGIGRYAFGVSLPVFGALHFIYWQYVASVIPGWIPGSPVFWAYFTGCAHIAAGLAILSGVQARLAATLLGSMFTSWVVLLHVPRVFAHPDHLSEWTSLCVAIGLSGVAWMMAGYFAALSANRPADLERHGPREPASA
jgi:uncharacterized membrane protein YphA (DoxX/SURF4 family)